MSSLYRCRARVGYRPSGSEQLIVFDERQIQELNVKLKWKPNAAFANADSSTEASVSTNALSASTCSVTISDPYLTGLAWPALFDAASLYTQSNIFSANNILLPPCGEKQDPYTDKCFKYVDSESDGTTSVSKFPFLVLSLWYDVKGTSFGSDFYFRVNGLSISHGARYPSVTIRGQEARSILFNQSLVNISLDEGLPIDKALKDLAEGQGYSVSFCSNTNSDPTKKRILPRTVRYTGVTVDEAIKKVLDSVSGNFLSMPTRDYANKISMCSRGEINQGCSVFYLGKGLYEGYEINGQPELTILALNAESGSNRNNADPYLSEAFKASTYVLGDMVPQKRKKAMEKVKKVAFPGLFEKAPKHVKNAPSTTGYVWREAKPASSNAKSAQVTNEEATKIQKDGLKLFGTAPNGTTSISFLSGVVQEAIEGSGRVLIKTKFALQICEKEGSQKCFFRPVFQESTNLSSVKVKPKDKVEISQELGSSTSDKPEFVRFYIMGHNDQLTVISPKIVWEWAFPETDIPTTQSPAVVGSGGGVVPSAPKQNLKDWKATTTNKPSKILLMAGHADFTSSGAPNEAKLNVELIKWAQRNASAYGVSDFVEFYLPSSGSIPETDPRSQYAKTSAGVSGGRQVIEIHNDQKSGNSGVIPPTGGKQIWPLDDALASQYGAFNKNWRDGLAVPKRGGTILEVGRMDDPTSRIFTSGTPAQKEALYKQLMDPTMRAIAAEKARKAGTATAPASSASSSAPSEGFIVGRVGSTGRSSGPHVHIQESTSRTLSEQQLRSLASKYVTVAGKSLTSYTQGQGFGAGRDHAGIDYPIKAGEPVSVTGTIVAAGPGVGGSDCGNGVAFKPPEGPELLICHLQDKSIPPNLAGMSVSSGGGKSKPTISGSPATQGLTMETSFKGIPRSLRIIPGRTILSFITDYDAWVEEGRPASRDPGVWIPNRFKNWFVNECEYRWREGDLRVQIEAVSAWGTQLTRVPTFTNYLKSMRDSGDAKITSNYYDYIRSLGGLNWKVDGKDSTELYCPEAQNLSEFLSQGSDSTSPTDVATSFPPANCQYTGTKYPASRVNAIINAAKSAGINTKAGFAGVVGNALVESGVALSPTAENPRSKAFGVFQWLGGRRQGLESYASKAGKSASDFGVQMERFVQELKGADFQGPATVQALNSTNDPARAAAEFNRLFERAPGQKEAERQRYAQEIFSQLNCK